MLDNARTYPVPICYATPGEGEHADALVFTRWTRPSHFVMRSYVSEAQELLGWCTGQKSIEQICAAVSFDTALARQLIDGLMRQELLVDVGSLDAFNNVAAVLHKLKSSLPAHHTLTFGGYSLEPLGGCQVRMELDCGDGTVFAGAGMAPSFADAHLCAAAEAYERWVTASFSRVDRICAASEIQERWVDPRLAAPMTPWQQQFFGLSAFDPTAPWQWVRGTDWVSGKPVFVPFDMVGYGAGTRFNRRRCMLNCSSGVAVHTTRQQAARGALLELLERDALMRYWLLGRVPRRIRIEALPQSLQGRVAQLQAQGRRVDVLNFSHDSHGAVVIGVAIHGQAYPCFLLGMAATDQNWQQAATDQNWQQAATKAFTEADQADRWPPLPGDAPRISAVQTPVQHGELYAHPSYTHNALWLCGGDFGPAPQAKSLAEIVDRLSPVVVDLTGDGAPFFGVRVVCSELVPIAFGNKAAHFMHPALSSVVGTQIDFPVPFG